MVEGEDNSLFQLVQSGDLDGIRAAIETHKPLDDIVDEDGSTLLHRACYDGMFG
jgi:hypothetical protein